MEKIVNSSDNLFWNGWDIVCIKKDVNAFCSKDGIFKNGEWFIKTTYKLERSGWNLPEHLKENCYV